MQKIAKNKGKITGKHTILDDFRSKIKRGSQVLYITKADMDNPFYYSNHHFVVVDVMHEDVSLLEPKDSMYYGEKIVKVTVKLWNGRESYTTKNYDKLLDITKQLPKSKHKRLPKDKK